MGTPHSWLYTPADRADALASARARRAGARIIDLEDGCGQRRLGELRLALADVIPSVSQHQAVWLRVHSPALDPQNSQLDIDAVLSREVTGILLPKVAQRSEVDMAVAWIAERAKQAGVPTDSVQLGVMIETAASIENLNSLVQVERVTTLFFGRHDLEWQLNATAQSITIDYVRARLVIVSAAAGLNAPIEAPWMRLDDDAGLRAAAMAARRAGFGGMQCVHPSQLPAIESAFMPAREDVAWARRVVAARQETPDSVLTVAGEVIDAPIIARAERIIDEAAGDRGIGGLSE